MTWQHIFVRVGPFVHWVLVRETPFAVVARGWTLGKESAWQRSIQAVNTDPKRFLADPLGVRE